MTPVETYLCDDCGMPLLTLDEVEWMRCSTCRRGEALEADGGPFDGENSSEDDEA